MRNFKSLAALSILALALAACGGGSQDLAAGGSSSSGGSTGGSTGGTGGSTGGATTYSMGNGSGSSFQSGVIGLSSSSLSAGGTSSLSVTVVDQTGTLYTAQSISVNFNSPCVAQGLATIAASGTSVAGATAGSVTSTTGSVSAIYTAKGCSGSDVITATAVVASKTLTATGTVTVAAAAVGSIQFVSATPASIGLKGTGLGETSTVVFKVTDSTGGARPGVPVTFSLDSNTGGLTIAPTTATSAADGTVQTVVSSGTVHTTVRVKAAITTPALETESSALTVSTGLPASNAFSIAVGPATYGTTPVNLACPNVEAYNIDGVTVPVTVRLADRYNNPAPDGTSVAFTTDGGHVGASCTTPSSPANSGDGTCTVTWTSANPRPTTASVPPAARAGRVIVMATAIGEESFNDANGNGFYDSGETFVNLGEPYRDDNEDGAYQVGEYFLDFNHNGTRDAGDGTFKGITCSGGSCTTTTLAISASHLIVMSTSQAAVSFVSASSAFTGNGSGLTIAHSASGTITIGVSDANGNAMAAGTTVTVTASTAAGTPTVTPSPFVIGCDGGNGVQIPFSFSAASSPGSGTITIQVTSPNGTNTVFGIPVTVT
ncbi:MAG TPA: hypothetical protein VMT29_11430 [Steroidobacteraceae bacterium]|nr:hypothetical protein [Steroidobacteraceae bacterium]